MDEHELQEAAEKARAPFDRLVGASMAIIAAALAVVSVYGSMTITEELLSQQKASDQWAYYQSKSIRRYQSEFAQDMLGAMNAPVAARYAANAERYRKDSEQIQERARELERESEAKGRMALRLHTGEIFLEVAIVLSSLALLTRRRPFWLAGLASALAGMAIPLTVSL